METAQQRAAAEVLKRREVQADLTAWARHHMAEKGFSLAPHHEFILKRLQAATDGTLTHSATGKPVRNLIISLPPGSAKSTYGSVVFPVWFMQRRKGCRILACSHSADLIESFSRECRNTVQTHAKLLGYDLMADSRAVQEWSTTNGGGYRCAGVGAGIAGRRADAGLIDDFCGSQEDADSKLQRDKVWAWYLSDFWPRLKPGAIQVVIATRWHEEDLIGRLLDPQNAYRSPTPAEEWENIKIPFFAEENDVLGREVGQRLWAEWFDQTMEAGIKLMPPRIQAGLYQQRPAPEEGNYFKRDWLLPYTEKEYHELMRNHPRIYGAGDWAVSEEDDANRSCFGGAFFDHNNILYVHPDLFYKVAGPEEVVTNFMQWIGKWKPQVTWSEKGHISKAWGPFLRKMMLEANVFAYIEEVTPARAKDVRARSIQARMSMKQVRFPTWCPWWEKAEHELLTFPGGKTDDFVDFLAHIGMGLDRMQKTHLPRETAPEVMASAPLTLSWVKKSHNQRLQEAKPRYCGR